MPTNKMVLKQANYNLARRYSSGPRIVVTAIHHCEGCGAEATCLVNGRYFRCQACANYVVNLWNAMRLNKTEGD